LVTTNKKLYIRRVIMRLSLDDKVALVTGGGRGIGKSIALALAGSGASVAVAARTKSQLEEVAAEVESMGQRALALTADLTDVSSVEKMKNECLKYFGRIDILVNNSGVLFNKPTEEFTDNEWKDTIETNLSSVFYCTREIGKHMIERKSGKIINISSMDGIRPLKMISAYCAAKAGVILFTQAVAMEWAKHGINVNTIAPGYVKTPLMDRIMGEQNVDAEAVSKRLIPFKRFAKPEEIANLAVYLASEAGDYITGSVYVIDGGCLLR